MLYPFPTVNIKNTVDAIALFTVRNGKRVLIKGYCNHSVCMSV